jgi:Uma2 family endonuclease
MEHGVASVVPSSAMGAARRPATYEDLCKVPDHLVAEILDGELIVSPRPASPHARASSVLGGDLMNAFDRPPGDPRGPGGWWILDEPELHLGPDVIVPDLAGWRREHMAAIPSTAAFTQAPDWVCEVISPSTGIVDRSRKMRIYARERVGHLWIVDPILRTVEIYRLEGERWIVAATHGGDDPARLEPFEAVELDVARWWLESAPVAATP